MSTAMAPAEKRERLTLWMEKPDIRNQLVAAVGDVMDPDQFAAHMIVAFQADDVRGCSDGSKLLALHECAALGLDPLLGQVALVPYKVKDENGRVIEVSIKCTPQWQGLKALMERHPSLLEVTGHLVHVKDEFALVNGEVRHQYDPFAADRAIEKPADIRGGYCKIVYRDGRPPKYHFVTIRQINKAQKCAQTQKVWTAWYEAMAVKTLYRDCYARRAVPMDPLVQERLQRAINIDDVNLGNDPQRVLSAATEQHIAQARLQREGPREDTEPEAQPQDAEPDPDPPPKDSPAPEPARVVAQRYDAKIIQAKTIGELEDLHAEASQDERLKDLQGFVLKTITSAITDRRAKNKRGKQGSLIDTDDGTGT